MSICLYPVFEPSIDDHSESTGEFLGRYLDQLDVVAAAANLVALSTFTDSRPIPEGFDGPPWELDNVLGTWDEWFDCRSGATAAGALAKALKQDSALLNLLETPDEMIIELDNLAELLHKGASRDARFRLEVRY
jgi:hypothetical protein